MSELGQLPRPEWNFILAGRHPSPYSLPKSLTTVESNSGEIFRMATHNDTSLSDRGQREKAVTIAFLVAAWVFVLLRIWVRTCMIRNFGWDDATMVLANVRLFYSQMRSSLQLILADIGCLHVLLYHRSIRSSTRRWNSFNWCHGDRQTYQCELMYSRDI